MTFNAFAVIICLKQISLDFDYVIIFVMHLAGAPCNNFRGYCDVFQKCRDVDADGPLARLKKLLFNEETFNEIRDWIIVSITRNLYLIKS